MKQLSLSDPQSTIGRLALQAQSNHPLSEAQDAAIITQCVQLGCLTRVARDGRALAWHGCHPRADRGTVGDAVAGGSPNARWQH